MQITEITVLEVFSYFPKSCGEANGSGHEPAITIFVRNVSNSEARETAVEAAIEWPMATARFASRQFRLPLAAISNS